MTTSMPRRKQTLQHLSPVSSIAGRKTTVPDCYKSLVMVRGADLGGVFDGMKITVDLIIVK
jgi:hypothetical protein